MSGIGPEGAGEPDAELSALERLFEGDADPSLPVSGAQSGSDPAPTPGGQDE